MGKIVRYNGKFMSYYDCTSPVELVYGKEYEVIAENDRGWQTDYFLKGVKGYFNSVWFDDVKTFVGVTHDIPTLGKGCECKIVKEGSLVLCSTGEIRDVVNIDNNVYKVMTNGEIYILQVV